LIFFALSKEYDRRFAVDLLCRPLYSGGPLVELLVRAGVGKYLEFKCLQGENTLECKLNFFLHAKRINAISEFVSSSKSCRLWLLSG
jgi:RAB protein geranylgeranyltransferase component A